jgi:hypothetical protein
MRSSKYGKIARTTSGFTAVEMAISMLVLMVFFGTLVRTSESLRVAAGIGADESGVVAEGRKALERISGYLARSGETIADDGNAYPYIFEDGDASGAYAASWHSPADHHAAAGDVDYGVTSELVFCQPADADADGVPDVNAAGALDWDEAQYAFVLVTDDSGVNQLELWIDGAFERNIASYVERMVFDDFTTSYGEVQNDAVRVHLDFRWPGEDGTVIPHAVETTVRLKNS